MSVGQTSGISGTRSAQVMTTSTAARITPTGPSFSEVMGTGSALLLRGAAGAVRTLPVGQIVAASLRPLGALSSRTAMTPGPGAGLTPGLGGLSAEGGGAIPGTGTAGTGGVESALAQSQEMNLYMIELQERMAAENRAFTTYSNVLKARHDTVKNAISNIR
jgi:hypothetical protein